MPAYYAKRVAEFLQDSNASVIGELSKANSAAKFCTLESAQIDAWDAELNDLRTCLLDLAGTFPGAVEWGVLLEFPIPRRQKRVDAVLLAGTVIFVLEFKCGVSVGASDGLRQVEDYALDLADFHEPSLGKTIVPIVVSSRPTLARIDLCAGLVKTVSSASPSELARLIHNLFTKYTEGGQIQFGNWDRGRYRPVPTVIEAAMAIFAGMEVRDIAHSHTEASNLTATVTQIMQIIQSSKDGRWKSICFVTGVPGSGKTLAGLRAVHDPALKGLGGSDPAFMSGNGPLVKVLREALARDLNLREGCGLGKARRSVCTLIQNIHEFARDNDKRDASQPPHEKIVVFDEAQRAWSAEKNKKKYSREASEPSMILKVMDRHPDWAVLICLVGGGQEIHDGEAGLAEWGKTLCLEFSHWKVFVSQAALEGGQSVAGSRLFENSDEKDLQVTEVPSLHLPVSTRSYKSEAITAWSNALLRGRMEDARAAIPEGSEFPVRITRDLNFAKEWLRKSCRGSSRSGLVASSGAPRLRAYGIETSTNFHRGYPYEMWFLNDRKDVRSSYQLEVVATEFEIQGLELDWVGLCWGGDLVWDREESDWKERVFSGTTWKQVKKSEDRKFLRNSYRVLLTRARQGTVIWVPPGDELDSTLRPHEFDDIARALLASGVAPLT